MSLENLKITQSQIVNNGVSSAPDKLTGSAAKNKAVFDNLVKTIVANSINEIINTLTSPFGAQSIGMQDLYGEQADLNIFSAIDKMRFKVDSDKANVEQTNAHLKNVEYNEETGTFVFTRENGEIIKVDTALEKISINFAYNPETESLVIKFLDGTTQNVPLSSLISENEWNESETIKFNVDNHKVSAIVKYDSITDAHLSSTLREALISYVSEAQNYAVAAANFQNGAKNFATDAEQSKMLAEIYAKDASESKDNAKTSSQAAAKSATNADSFSVDAENSAKASKQYAAEAEKARDDAVEIAGFDPTEYVKKTDYATTGGGYGLVKINESPYYGLRVKADGYLIVEGASSSLISNLGIINKKTMPAPITASNLTFATKVGLLSNANFFTLNDNGQPTNPTDDSKEFTDAEKSAIADWLGLSSVQMAIGSYDGADNPKNNIPTLPFVPKIVILTGVNSGSDTKGCTMLAYNPWRRAIKNSIDTQADGSGLEFKTDVCACVWDNDNKTVEFTGVNQSGYTYTWLAFGEKE